MPLGGGTFRKKRGSLSRIKVIRGVKEGERLPAQGTEKKKD